MKYKLLIFDLDGTILDTLDDLAASVNYALNKNSLPLRTTNEIRSFVGNGIRLLIERAVPQNCSKTVTDRVFTDFKEHYSIHSCDKTKPYNKIPELLYKLRIHGYITAVISNKADFAVKTLVKKYFDGLFDYYIGEREGIPKKPSPESVYEVISHFNLECKDSVYIGDSEVDIETAANAGIDLICVDWGFRSKQQLIESGAVSIVSDAEELSDRILQK